MSSISMISAVILLVDIVVAPSTTAASASTHSNLSRGASASALSSSARSIRHLHDTRSESKWSLLLLPPPMSTTAAAATMTTEVLRFRGGGGGGEIPVESDNEDDEMEGLREEEGADVSRSHTKERTSGHAYEIFTGVLLFLNIVSSRRIEGGGVLFRTRLYIYENFVPKIPFYT